MKHTYMTSIVALSALLLIGGGCVTATALESTQLPADDPYSATPEQQAAAEKFIDQTYAPEEYLGRWNAPDLGAVIVFDTGSTRSLGTFHAEVNGENVPGHWYVYNGALILETTDKTIKGQYKSAVLKGSTFSLTSYAGKKTSWTRL